MTWHGTTDLWPAAASAAAADDPPGAGQGRERHGASGCPPTHTRGWPDLAAGAEGQVESGGCPGGSIWRHTS